MRHCALILILTICVAVLTLMYGQSIEISRQIPLYESLRNTSSIIFGVMGAWIAIIHPDSLKQVFGSGDAKISENERTTINLLLAPIVISTIIIAFVLILLPLIELAKTVDFFLNHRNFYRGAAFSILSILTFLQLWALILTLVPGDILKKHIDKQEAKTKVRKRMFAKATKRKAPGD